MYPFYSLTLSYFQNVLHYERYERSNPTVQRLPRDMQRTTLPRKEQEEEEEEGKFRGEGETHQVLVQTAQEQGSHLLCGRISSLFATLHNIKFDFE